MGKSLREKISDIKEKPKKIAFVFRNFMWEGFSKKLLFLIWLVLLIYFPIWNPIYTDESQWIHLDEVLRALIDLIFSLLQLTLLFFTIIHQLLEKKMENKLVFFLFLLISAVCAFIFYFFIPYSIIVIPLFGIGAYILQNLSIIGNSAPIVQKLSKPFHFENRQVKPFWFITIESVIVIFGIVYVKNYILSDELNTISPYAYKFWAWTTVSFLIVAILILFVIRKKDTPFYRQMKGFFLFIIPILQIYNIYIIFQDILSILTPEGSSLPLILDLIVFSLLALWELLKSIGNQIDLRDEIDTSKFYSSILWSYSITAFVQYNALFGAEDGFTLNDFSEMLSLIFAGFGILYMVNNLGKSVADQRNIQNFSLKKFLSGKEFATQN
ncbi:hypothetical protein [Candidatus Lokiarchaeum ossiferum]|uniref:hypothetical protein n=1 Tax=Candidatus Lokiarchaeum ossiferum TaxID=2951803 RepID=UPI00352F69EC